MENSQKIDLLFVRRWCSQINTQFRGCVVMLCYVVLCVVLVGIGYLEKFGLPRYSEEVLGD